MTNVAELEVLKVLARTAKAIRRGEKLELVEPATKWETQFSTRIQELEKSKEDGGDEHNQQAA